MAEQLLPINWRCPQCDGRGVTIEPRTAVFADGNVGTINVPEKCKACTGEGWLPLGRA